MKNGWTISPLKTWHGMRWVVVDEKRNVAQLKESMAAYAYNKQGLEDARRTLKQLRSE